MIPQITIPVVADHALYIAASTPMLNAIKEMRPAIRYLVTTLTDPKQREAIGAIWHQSLEIQSILRQIEDVEKSISSGS